MRKILTLTLCLAFQYAFGQQIAFDSVKADVLRLVAGVNLSRASSGIVLDVGRPYADLTLFNGIASDSNRFDFFRYERVYNTLLDAQLSSNLPAFEIINAALEQSTTRYQLALAVTGGKYHRFAQNAEQSGKIRWVHDHFEDVGDAPSPFIACNLLAATLSRTYVEVGRVYDIVMPTAARIAIGGATLQEVKLDLRDGKGLQTITPGSGISFVPTTVGVSYIKVHAQVNGTPLITEIEVTAKGRPTQPNTPTVWPFVVDRIVNVLPRAGVHAGGTLHIGFAESNRPVGDVNQWLLRDPLIVLEGIDFNDVAPHIVQSGTTYEDIVSEFNFRNAQLSQGTNGRDLVFLNYNNSTASIQSNADLFKEVLAWVNANRQTNLVLADHPAVVVGISMGGLVARLGLAQLVQANNNVDNTFVSLLFTQDSPHSGANVPVAFQILARSLIASGRGIYAAINPTPISAAGIRMIGRLNQQVETILNGTYLRELIAIADCPAADNMLIAKFSFDGLTFNTNYSNAWLAWYQAQVANVPGAQYRFVPTTLGSECGIGQDDILNRIFYSYSVRFSSRPGSFRLIRHDHGLLVRLNGMPNESVGGSIVTFNIDDIVRVISLGNFAVYERRYNLVNLTANVDAGDGHKAWDFAPGGSLSTGDTPTNISTFSPVYLLDRFVVTYMTETTVRNFAFCFIPAASGLGQSVQSDLALFRPRNYFVNSPVVSPPIGASIANFSAERPRANNATNTMRHNFTHPFFTERSAALLRSEATNTAYTEANCPAACEPTQEILGPRFVCSPPGSNISLQVGAFPPGSTVTWTTTGGNLISGQGTGSAQFSNVLPNNINRFTVEAEVLTPQRCRLFGSRSFTVLGPAYVATADQPEISRSPAGGTRLTYLTHFSDQYQWIAFRSVGNNQPTVLGSSRGWVALPLNTPNVQIDILPPCTVVFYVRNRCQNQNLPETDYFSINLSFLPGGRFVKNPVVYQEDQTARATLYAGVDSSEIFGRPVEAELMDERDKVVWSGSFPDGRVDVNLEGLLPAHYILSAKNGDITWTLDLYLASPGKALVVSPNPARQGLDDSISVALTVPKSFGDYTYTLADFAGNPLFQTTSQAISAKLPIGDIAPGTYQVIVSGSGQSWSEDVDFLLKGMPYLTLSPNPAATNLRATLNDPVYPKLKASWEIFDTQGNFYYRGDDESNTNFISIPVSDLPLGRTYILKLTDGLSEYNKHFQIAR